MTQERGVYGQLSLFPELEPEQKKQKKAVDPNKRNWENAFQRWSNERAKDGSDPVGCCGYGVICDYCTGNDYGKPCVRALNKMCREKGTLFINYKDRSKEYFEEVWHGRY